MLTNQSAAYRNFSEQLDKWNLHPIRGNHVLLIHDPFAADWNGWDPLFIVNDRAGVSNITVTRMRLAENAPPPSEANLYDYVIDYDNQWRLLKSPGLASPAIAARIESLEQHAEIRLLEGLSPPSRDGWRSVRREFSLRVSPHRNDRRSIELSLYSAVPVHLFAAMDRDGGIDKGVHGPGSFAISTVLPDGNPHNLSIRVENAEAESTAAVIFVTSKLATVD